MDSLITAAARRLAMGDPLGALDRIALRNDPPALALRGIAMAQLGDFAVAKSLLRRAAKGFGSGESVARARCVVAEAEIALASRDLAWPTKALREARAVLDEHHDTINAAHARQLEIRRLVLIGHLSEAEALLDAIVVRQLPPALLATHELMRFSIALRRLRIRQAKVFIARATQLAREAAIPSLAAEVESAAAILHVPSAELITARGHRMLLLHEVEALFDSKTCIVDACRYTVRDRNAIVNLARRPILFKLVRLLAERWPQDVSRATLIATAFRTKHANESHRVRLRVELGRLRAAMKGIADVKATKEGFALIPRAKELALLVRPVEDENAAMLALLSDGEAWSSSAAALALGASQRSVQRALEALKAQGKVQTLGEGRARRWIAPLWPGFATILLLPAPHPND